VYHENRPVFVLFPGKSGACALIVLGVLMAYLGGFIGAAL
jgi:hypothetical protein